MAKQHDVRKPEQERDTPSDLPSTASTPKASTLTASSFSRVTLYAPLVAYHQTRVEPSNYLRSVGTLPKSVGEAALKSFLGAISCHHHLSKASLHGKNTSARPLQEYDVRDRLQQRALMLVGGGFYGNSNKKNDAVPKGRSARSRIRKRKSRVKKSQKIPEEVWNEQVAFLKELNQRWNRYAWSLFQPPDQKQKRSTEDEFAHHQSLTLRVKRLSKTMDWVGARVRLDQCASLREKIGCQGILMEDTACTWQIFPMDTTGINTGRRRIVIPKKSSIVTVLLPTIQKQEEGKECVSNGSKPTEYLSIVLQDGGKKEDCSPS
jgi:hypothetical protein